MPNHPKEQRGRRTVAATKDGDRWLDEQLLCRLEARRDAFNKQRYEQYRKVLRRGAFAAQLARTLFDLCCVPKTPTELEQTVAALNNLLDAAAEKGEARTKFIDPAVVAEYYFAADGDPLTTATSNAQLPERTFLQTYLIETLRRPHGGQPIFSDEKARQWIDLLEALEFARRAQAVTALHINQNAKVVTLLHQLHELLLEWVARVAPGAPEALPAENILHFCSVAGSIEDTTRASVAVGVSAALYEYLDGGTKAGDGDLLVSLPTGVEGVAIALGPAAKAHAYLIVADRALNETQLRQVLLHEIEHLRSDLGKTTAPQRTVRRGRPTRAF